MPRAVFSRRPARTSGWNSQFCRISR